MSEISELEWPNQQVCQNFIVLDKDIPVTIEEEVVASSSGVGKAGKKKPYSNSRSVLKKSALGEIPLENMPQESLQQFPESHARLPSLSETSDCDTEKVVQRSKKNVPSRTNLSTTRHVDRVKSPKRKRTKGKHSNRPPRHKKSINEDFGENITIIHDSGDNLRSPVGWIGRDCEGTIPRDGNESDEEVDIESEDNPTDLKPPSPQQIISEEPKEPVSQEKEEVAPKRPEVPEHIRQILDSAEIPQMEKRLIPNEVTPIEKFIFAEFFEGRVTKTPDRFLKIRTHIINSWTNARPAYVGKTAARSGLKNCGDVNCISRIHTFLEQTGVINFGHAGEYFHYIRPLWRLLDTFTNLPRKNSSASIDGKIIPGKRNRVRYNDGMNVTIQHSDETLLRIPNAQDSTTKWKRSRDIELVKCKKFTETQLPPFSVTVTLSTLLSLQLHSLTSRHEVMGFLGGQRHASSISLERYKPCRTSKQSGTMCEMCPVSQVEQSDSLVMEGFQLLGWFHSHPLFPPNPSRTDIETQAEMQRHFSADDSPFVGFILGCVEMKFKCIYIVGGCQAPDEDSVYEIDVSVSNDFGHLERSLQDILSLFEPLPQETVEKVRATVSLTSLGCCESSFGFLTKINVIWI